MNTENCYQCGRAIKPGDSFCDHCGAAQEERVERGTLDVESCEGPPLCGGDNPELSAVSSLPVSILWNTARKFVEGTTLSFNMRVNSEQDLRELEVVVVSDVDGIDRLVKKIASLSAHQEHRIDLPFKAPVGSSGQLPFDVYLRFKSGGGWTVFQGGWTHSVYREEQAPQAVHYHASTTVNTGSGHAADHHVQVKNADMPDISRSERKALWEEINGAEVWTALELMEVDDFPEKDIVVSENSATESTETQREEAGRFEPRKTRNDTKKIASAIALAAGVAVMASFVWDRRDGPVVSAPVPVQVNVIQQVGGGEQMAVVESAVAVENTHSEEKSVPASKSMQKEEDRTPVIVPQVELGSVKPKSEIREREVVSESNEAHNTQRTEITSAEKEGQSVAASSVAIPVQVNVVQQVGGGEHSAVVTTPAQSIPVERVPKVVVNPDENMPDAEPDEFGVKLELVGGRTAFVAGEKLQYRIKSERDCYVALLCYQVDGTTVVLFPNLWNSDSFVRSGTNYLIPDGNSGFEIEVSAPFGEDKVELIACTGRSEFHRMLGGYAAATTRGMPFSIINREKVDEVVTRGMKAVPVAGAGEVKWLRKSMLVRTQSGELIR